MAEIDNYDRYCKRWQKRRGIKPPMLTAEEYLDAYNALVATKNRIAKTMWTDCYIPNSLIVREREILRSLLLRPAYRKA